MSVQHIVNEALQRARSTAGGGGTSKTASTDDNLIKLANQLADANEWIALSATDDGTADGRARRGIVESFFKSADTSTIPGPTQCESPTGTQAVPPQSGAKKLLSLGKASGGSPDESGAPTGTQATLDQTGTKKAGGNMTLLDMITKNADTSAIPGPKQSVAGENAAAPPPKHENTNIGALRSAEGMVSMTRREAKAPTRERLKQLFAHADDTGPSSAAAQAAFPNAYAKGGMKVADADPDKKTYPISRFLTSPGAAATGGALMGALHGAGISGALHGAGISGALVGGTIGAGIAGGGVLANRALHARAALGRANTGDEGVMTSDKRVISRMRAGGKVAAADFSLRNWVGGRSQASRGDSEIEASRKTLGMSYNDRAEMLRAGHLNRAEGESRARLLDSIGMGASGALAGAAPGALLAARRGGGSLGRLLVGAGLGGALGGGGAYGISRLREGLSRETAGDEMALRADVLKHTANKSALRNEHASLADLVAAREGRKAQGGGMFSVNINKDGSPYDRDTKRTAVAGEEKRASLYDYAKLASLAESGGLGDEAREVIHFAEDLVT